MTYGANGKAREVNRVGTHVGDVTALIERLCYAHCLCYREAELARCFLLQGGSGERWGRALLYWLYLDVGNSEGCVFAVLEQFNCLLAIVVALVEFARHYAAVGIASEHFAAHAVVLLTLKVANLLLTLGKKAHCHALHATGTQCRLDFLPQHWR